MRAPERPALVLHACCAVCAGYPLARLRDEYEPLVFFSNPNIAPRAEYERRRDECWRYALALGCVFVEDAAAGDGWEQAVGEWADEPEGGRRCAVCIRYRLARAAAFARERGVGFFTTTLTVSPHKNSVLILGLGAELAGESPGLAFLPENFKKQGGFEKTMAIAREWGFYRQSYCGCRVS
ncbi:MAG: epoxyqueuosine reductase QueH [Gracilibacteraceae bacterium]|nr:epoxyqueuosine reductase QueH [Gracilibacteraceae bacterium]